MSYDIKFIWVAKVATIYIKKELRRRIKKDIKKMHLPLI